MAEREEVGLVVHAASITWELCDSAISDGVRAECEHLLGVTFPREFRDVMQRCPGGHPVERSDFNLLHPGMGRVESCLGALLSLDPTDESGIVHTTRDLRQVHGLPAGVIPFAHDGGGDYMCLDFRATLDHPAVVYWAHEATPEMALAPLARSFLEFLAMLAPPESLD